MTKEKLIEAQDIFLDRVNQICSKFGLNNIMAQLYVVLYFHNGAMSLDDMVKRLKISKASASVNIRALERYGAVRRVWVKGSRKDYYEADIDISKVIKDRIKSMANSRLSAVNDMIRSSSNMIDTVVNGDESGDESVKVFKERLAKIKDLYEQAQSMFDLFNAMVLNKSTEGVLLNGNTAARIEERV
ncbi:MAG: hypothetical protein NC938_02890 [Candidatus Omnitrophica bacterium]|nr:hypothetical protein [Candidatus Omnitrophota bacterium]MCM8790626.1 hypothetical protein [Candidatus Omnitrophota bacterium]